MGKRIVELPEKQTISNGDFMMTDNEGSGHAKYNIGAKIYEMDHDVSKAKTNIGAICELTGVKNLIPYPYFQSTSTISGVTFTDNGDGTITVDGTATANITFTLINRSSAPLHLSSGWYVLSGCPEGGSASTYNLALESAGSGMVYTISYIDDGDGINLNGISARDAGLVIKIYNGQTLSNVVFRPMLRLASDEDGEWMQYRDPDLNNYLLKTEDGKDNTETFTSSDVADGSASSWTSVTQLDSGEKHSSIFAKVSQMFKNIRYLYKMLGTTSLSSIGDGTVTGAISTLNGKTTFSAQKITSFYDNRCENIASGEETYILKCGNMYIAVICVKIKKTLTSSQTSILTIPPEIPAPSGYQPWSIIYNRTTGKLYQMDVSSAGNVNILNRGELAINDNLLGQIAWMA